MEDVKRSVIPNVDLLLRIERVGEFNGGLTKTTANNAGSCIAFLLVKPGADLKARTDEILAFFKERFWMYKGGFAEELKIVSIPEMYFGNWM